jgi:prepilin-type N-terminal cleavage/methylation domain-containing protein
MHNNALTVARHRGLTLIELLVVVAIIGILSTVTLALITGARASARDAARLASLDQLNKAILAYTIDKGVPPGEDGVMYVNGTHAWIPGLVPEYVSALPVDPRDTTKFSFRYMRQGNEYALVAHLERSNSSHGNSDGGVSNDHYEIYSGPPFALTEPDASDWRFAEATSISSHLSCPVVGSKVTICHVPGGDTSKAQTLRVACTAVGPEGHSNHDHDYLGPCMGDESGGGDEQIEPPVTCPVTITPALTSYTSGAPVQLSWDTTCYPATAVMLEVRKVTSGESSPFIMIYSFANNSGTYPYQGFPSGLIGSDQWVVRVTDYQTRTNFNESAPFTVAPQAPDTTPPSVPQGLSATSSSHTETVLWWQPSTDDTAVAGYRLYRNGVLIATTANTSHVDSGLTPDTPYIYTVLAFDAAGNESDHSAPFGARTPQAPQEPTPSEPAVALCPVTLTPAQSSYVSGTPVQLTWDKTCYPSTRVMLEVRKMTTSGSAPYIMIFSGASNTGTYPYQGFPSATIGAEQWVVRVTNDNPRTILNESATFRVTAN